jgi:serine/threonine-protein kinase HSL1 (negative regulator of Swe1 kinase)
VSEASYDPFRASKQPIVPGTPGLQNPAFDRSLGHGSRRPRPATALDHSAGASLRKQALHSVVSRGSSKRSTPSQRSGLGRSGSRSTLGSSHWASSPPVVARTGGLGRRGVSFTHLRERRSSAATTSTVDYSTRVNSPVQSISGDGRRGSVGSYRSSVRSVKNQPSAAHRIKARLPGSSAIPRLRLRGPDSPTKYIQTEARKVSTELGRVMEEAFNRSSMSSSICTTGMETSHEASMSQYDTPPTSISNRDSGGSTIASPNTQAMLTARPLPPLPTETPNTFLHRKLAETRADIARRLTEDDGNTEHFSQVLEHLDRLLLSPSNTKRVVSAPARPTEHAAILQVIPEEVKADGGDGFEKYKTSTRAVTDPIRPQNHRAATAQGTIRVVEPSPNHVAPLNIRKRSGASLYSKAMEDGVSVACSEPGANGSVRSYRDVQNDLLAARTSNNALPQENNNNTIKKKKSSWFRRNVEERDHSAEPPEAQIRKKKSIGPLQIPEAWQSLDDRTKSPNQISGVEFTKHAAKQSMGSVASEFPMRSTEAAAAKNDGVLRKGFFGLFGRKKETKSRGSMELARKYTSALDMVLTDQANLEQSTSAHRLFCRKTPISLLAMDPPRCR